MNFFKSVFSDEPDLPSSEPVSKSPNDPPHDDLPDPDFDPKPSSDPDSSTGSGLGWSFGGLIKTLSTKSESVIETYRRDLQEFGSGLRKEIEVAHGSLETVGHTIDEFGNTVLKGTAQIISQGKDAILTVGNESDSDTSQNYSSIQHVSNSKPYSRFESQVRAIQGDLNTYCEEVEDVDDYTKWKLGFDLKERSEEIDTLFAENEAIDSIYKKVVPNVVDNETFWFRYFYRVHKHKLAEDARANLVKRAISREEEDLSWDVDDDDDEEDESPVGSKVDEVKNRGAGGEDSGKNGEAEEIGKVSEESNVNELIGKGSDEIVKEEVSGDDQSGKKMNLEEGDSKLNEKDPIKDEKLVDEGKSNNEETCKDIDVSVVPSQSAAPEEEDLEWDEIEDLSSIDDKKVIHVGSPKRAELRKRLSTAEEDEEEDLSWDIEDDDQPPKA